MNQREQMQLQMYRELQKMYRTAHDINQHVSALKTWIFCESCQKAEQYLSDLSDAARNQKSDKYWKSF